MKTVLPHDLFAPRSNCLPEAERQEAPTAAAEPKEVKGEKEVLDAFTPPVSPVLPVSIATRTPQLGWLPVDDDIYVPAPKANPVVAALKESSLYHQQAAADEHTITCPWTAEHDENSTGAAFYLEPDHQRPIGAFTCPHRHAAPRGISQLLDRFGIDKEMARCKPRLRLLSGETVRLADRAERLLAAAGSLYQSGGAIVIVDTKSLGDARVRVVGDQGLTKALSNAADWVAVITKDKAETRVDPPSKVVNLLAKSADFEHLPVLDHLTRQPYFTGSNGTLVVEPGYNPQTCIYAAFGDEAFSVGEASHDAAIAALVDLKALISEFHFATEADRSAAVCAMLTAAARSSLPLAPAFNITASTPGSGKSYLADLVAAFAGRADAMKLSYPTTSDEADKAMLAALIEKPAAICFDDMQTDWRPHGTANRMLTSPTIAGRILGSTKTIQAGTGTLFIGTGNNVGPVRDMCRRVITIRLAPRSATPATLDYVGKPVEQMKANRARYVSLALTIIRSWIEAGSPKADVPSIATYGQWSDMCRHSLIWLGQPDPAVSLIEQVTHDTDSELLGHLLGTWFSSFGDRPMTTRAVLARCAHDDALRDAIEDLPVTDGRLINNNKLGWYLKRNADRIVEGFFIVKGPTTERNSWSVRAIDPAAAIQAVEAQRKRALDAASLKQGIDPETGGPIDEIF